MLQVRIKTWSLEHILQLLFNWNSDEVCWFVFCDKYLSTQSIWAYICVTLDNNSGSLKAYLCS